ncbi:MAG TPA: hypothetical protein ENH29_08610 [Bacteroidetes bacterium]|nr:hypothetical protein [Bacteroidota bacterium]
MNFEFVTATRIIFGTGMACQIEQLACRLGVRAFIVTGREQAGFMTCVNPFILPASPILEADIPTVVAKSKNASSMLGNPVQLTDNEMREILTSAL